MPVHNQLVKSAQQTVEDLGILFDEIRSGASPIWKAYNTILRSGLRGDSAETLQNAIEGASRKYLRRASNIGGDQAERDARIYGETFSGVLPQLDRPVELISQEVALQLGTAETIIDYGGQPDEVTGGESRSGIVDPLPIIGAVIFWGTRVSTVTYTNSISKTVGTEGFVKQAVAVIDMDTTETCLNVHGTFADSSGFHLSGTPRYSDVMDSPPFHKGCRTSVAYIAQKYVQDNVTNSMREEAIAQKNAPPTSSMEGRAHYRVYGNVVREFRDGGWRKYKQFKSNFEARKEAASLNNARRS